MSLCSSKRKLSSRIERILLRHQDINHHIIWQDGKSNPGDYLSRHATPIATQPFQAIDDSKEHHKILFLLHQPITSTITKERNQEAQAKDKQLERVRHFIAIGQAPNNDPTLKQFSKIFHELSIGADDVIDRGEQFILPPSLHDDIITIAHASSHAGQYTVKRRIRAHCRFPGLDDAVGMRLELCHDCQVHSRNEIKVTIVTIDIDDSLSTVKHYESN